MTRLACADVQQALLDPLTETTASLSRAAIDAHVASCSECDSFRAAQQALDARLHASLVAPRLSSSFRVALSRRLDSPAPRFAGDALPDILHLASCAILTAFCAQALPADASLIVAVGTVATVSSHLLLAAVRNTLDESAL